MAKFGKIPTEHKTIIIAVREVESQRIMEEAEKKLAEANAKLLKALGRHGKGGQ